VTLDRQRTGDRTFDYNTDGVAHYGLYADWTDEVRSLGGPQIVNDLLNGPEAYLQMWERASGVTPNACTNPANTRTPSYLHTNLPAGTDWWTVLQRAGQPDRRLDHQFTYCTTTGTLTVNFNSAGKVTTVTG